jgi:hypothetical protein
MELLALSFIINVAMFLLDYLLRKFYLLEYNALYSVEIQQTFKKKHVASSFRVDEQA